MHSSSTSLSSPPHLVESKRGLSFSRAYLFVGASSRSNVTWHITPSCLGLRGRGRSLGSFDARERRDAIAENYSFAYLGEK